MTARPPIRLAPAVPAGTTTAPAPADPPTLGYWDRYREFVRQYATRSVGFGSGNPAIGVAIAGAADVTEATGGPAGDLFGGGFGGTLLAGIIEAVGTFAVAALGVGLMAIGFVRIFGSTDTARTIASVTPARSIIGG